MMQRLALFLSGVSLLALIGCGGSAVVATVGDQKITLNEFEESYAKNNGGWDTASKSTVDDRQKFLDLLIKFRLKVKEAKELGLQKDSAVVSEFDSYRSSVAQSYMLEKELIEPHLRQMYDHKKEELRASHILIRVAENAAPADTLKAWNRAMKVVAMAARTPFDTLARAYSEDPSASFNYGDIGWFSANRMVPEFESACYAMKAGEITQVPVRTQFGYHIIKLTGRRPNKGAADIYHVLLRFDPSMKDTAAVTDTAWMVYRKLKAGMPWDQAVREYSQDPRTVGRNGEIGYYERSNVPPAVAEPVWSLQKDSISQPVRFSYGYHIFKVANFQGVPTFDEDRKNLRQIYEGQRYAKDLEQFNAERNLQYNLAYDTNTMSMLSHAFDSTKTTSDSAWDAPISTELRKKNVFTYRGGAMTVAEFIQKLEAAQEFKTYKLTLANVEMMVKRIAANRVMEEYANTVLARYPELAQLMKEYEDGILLYRIEQDEVWKKVVVNDSLLKLYYAEHKDNYRWPERVNVAEIYTPSDSLMKAAQWKLAYGEDFLSVAEEYTARSGYKEKRGVWGLQPTTLNELTQRGSTMGVDSVSEWFRNQGGWSIIKVLGKDTVHVKAFEDAAPEVASAYQDEAAKAREKQWIESLKMKYPVTINSEVLAEAFKRKYGGR